MQRDPVVQRVWERGSSFSAVVRRGDAADEVVIKGNREGLITLARIFLFLAQHPEAGDRVMVTGDTDLVFIREDTLVTT